MDAGVAAILGATVGGILGATGTLGTAFLSGHLQGRNHHAQLQRDGRRTTYSELLRSAAALERAIDKLYSNAGLEERNRDEISEQAQLVIEHSHALRAAASTVMIEGPSGVGELAKTMAEGAEELADHLEDGQPSRETSWETGSFWDISMGHFVHLKRQTEQFTTEAQKALEH
ncbi:hypothetical protein [Streptomyces sp. 8N616]|uniref:hypothetical protein n=1 Tax=Streptomyces sp. 8N616 TaxID=3457414 RepID=UPI003FD4FFD0